MKLEKQIRGGGVYRAEDGHTLIVRRRTEVNCPPGRHLDWTRAYPGGPPVFCPGNKPHVTEWWETFDLTNVPCTASQTLADARAELVAKNDAAVKARLAEVEQADADHCTLVNPMCPEDLCVLPYGHPGTPRREHLLGSMYGSADLDAKQRERIARPAFMAPKGTPIEKLMEMGADARADAGRRITR